MDKDLKLFESKNEKTPVPYAYTTITFNNTSIENEIKDCIYRNPGPVDCLDYDKASILIKQLISNIARSLDKPLVLLFDEADCLSNGTLITFLRQLRDGFVNRIRAPFAHSVALVGMRDIRDYKSKIREGRETLGSASPFNIITKSLTIGNFSLDEVENLYLQHQHETGQIKCMGITT